jgi:hypothetical protein
MKKSYKALVIRAPDWVEDRSPDRVCNLKGSPPQLPWASRYINVGAIHFGDTLDFPFPQPTRTVQEKIGTVKCPLQISGNTVVSIDSLGKRGALDIRSNYQSRQIPWRKAQGFAPVDRLTG